jgi:hypothetical protein
MIYITSSAKKKKNVNLMEVCSRVADLTNETTVSKRELILNEILQTEKAYVEDLQTIIEVFTPFALAHSGGV